MEAKGKEDTFSVGHTQPDPMSYKYSDNPLTDDTLLKKRKKRHLFDQKFSLSRSKNENRLFKFPNNALI